MSEIVIYKPEGIENENQPVFMERVQGLLEGLFDKSSVPFGDSLVARIPDGDGEINIERFKQGSGVIYEVKSGGNGELVDSRWGLFVSANNQGADKSWLTIEQDETGLLTPTTHGDLSPMDGLARGVLLEKVAKTSDLYHRTKLPNYRLEEIKAVLGRIQEANGDKDLADPVPATPRYLDIDGQSNQVQVLGDLSSDSLYGIIESDPETGEIIRKWVINTVTGELDMPPVWRNGREMEVGQESFYALIKERYLPSLLRRVEKSAEAERNIKTMADTAIDRAALDITEQ